MRVLNTRVKILRTLPSLLVAGSSALVTLSATAAPSEARTAAHASGAAHLTRHSAGHSGTHLTNHTAEAGVPGGAARHHEDASHFESHSEGNSVAHSEHNFDANSEHNSEHNSDTRLTSRPTPRLKSHAAALAARRVTRHAPGADGGHAAVGVNTSASADGAGHVLSHVALHASHNGGGGGASTPRVMDAEYVRTATGINIYGAAKDWHVLAAQYGYLVSDRPVPGGVVSFEGGAYGASDAYGFVGVVVYYHDGGAYWEVGARYAYPAEGGSHYDGSYVREQAFHVRKDDPKAHYIYRRGMNARPGGYYTRPEYDGYNVVGRRYELSAQTPEVVVYPEGGHAKAYVGPNQVVRLLAKAEPGETIWVFVHTPYRAGTVYAMTHYGGKGHLREFDDAAPDAAQMYYAKNYGDTVLDLGYADYSRIAGDSREVTVTIKKGGDPARLQLLQAVRLQLAGT